MVKLSCLDVPHIVGWCWQQQACSSVEVSYQHVPLHCRLVLATSKHIAGVLEGPVARLAEPQVIQTVQQAAQGIAWEDWVPLEGGAQFAQGAPPTSLPPPQTLLLSSGIPPPALQTCSVTPHPPPLPCQKHTGLCLAHSNKKAIALVRV